jgi:hypothetical protein
MSVNGHHPPLSDERVDETLRLLGVGIAAMKPGMTPRVSLAQARERIVEICTPLQQRIADLTRLVEVVTADRDDDRANLDAVAGWLTEQVPVPEGEFPTEAIRLVAHIEALVESKVSDAFQMAHDEADLMDP